MTKLATKSPDLRAVAAAAPELEPGQVLANRFRLAKPLGTGSIGAVWLAEDECLNNDPVACKVLRRDIAAARKSLADLKHEVLLTRKLRHPNIPAMYTLWESDPWQFITMEYVEGRNLDRALMARGRPFTVPEVLPWLRQLCDALDYAHARGVLHRDIKPANVLLTKGGHVFLADFGIASLAASGENDALARAPQGTVPYISPEQLTGGTPGVHSDVYSLAATVYALLSGNPPFHSGELIAQIQIKPAPPIEHLSEKVNRVLLRALAKSPGHRMSSCGSFYNAFSLAAEGEPVSPAAQQAFRVREEDKETIVLGAFDNGARRTRLGRMLVETGAITQEQLAEALRRQQENDEKLGEALTALGYATEEAIAETLSCQLQIPRVIPINMEADRDLALKLGEDGARRHRCFPVRRTPYSVVVAMADPLDMAALNHLEQVFNASIDILVATSAELSEQFARAYVGA